eukprot:Pgem_evm1s2236
MQANLKQYHLFVILYKSTEAHCVSKRKAAFFKYFNVIYVNYPEIPKLTDPYFTQRAFEYFLK